MASLSALTEVAGQQLIISVGTGQARATDVGHAVLDLVEVHRPCVQVAQAHDQRVFRVFLGSSVIFPVICPRIVNPDMSFGFGRL